MYVYSILSYILKSKIKNYQYFIKTNLIHCFSLSKIYLKNKIKAFYDYNYIYIFFSHFMHKNINIYYNK